MGIYRFFWSKIGGRPWTFVLRDIWHKFEIVWITGLVSLGVWMGHNYDWDVVTKLWLVFCAGYLFGHLFWGKKYQENQRGS